jgi:hypothetical protein
VDKYTHQQRQQPGGQQLHTGPTEGASAASAEQPKVPAFDPTSSTVLSEVPTWELVRGLTIFTLCSAHWLIDPVIQLLRHSPTSLLGRPLTAAARATVFPHFCAGETLEECREVGVAYRRRGVQMLVDHSIEESEAAEAWGPNLQNKIRLIERVHSELDGMVSFIPVKITAVASPQLLEEMNALIIADPSHLVTEVDPRLLLSPASLAYLDQAEANLGAMCAAAAAHGIPLLLDAEQSHRQHAIDHLATRMMRRFNTGGQAVVYNTYQMYMTGSNDRVRRDLAAATQHGYCFAAKVVRGAYLVRCPPSAPPHGLSATGCLFVSVCVSRVSSPELVCMHACVCISRLTCADQRLLQVSEAKHASDTGTPYPLHPTKADTDRAYDTAINDVLVRISEDERAAAVMVATHNTDSVATAVGAMERVGLLPDCPRVNFAQVMGMCDHLAAALGKGGYNTSKLVLFGEFSEIFPWLLRRLDENRDLLGATQRDRQLLLAELCSRAGMPGLSSW